ERIGSANAGRPALAVSSPQPQREIGRAGARGQALLRQEREAALEALAGVQLGYRGVDLSDSSLHAAILTRRADAIGVAPAPARYARKVEVLNWERETPRLRSPVLVAAFAGWNDSANAATTALDTVSASLDATPIAEL